jgi:hypothetical protein
MGCQSGPDHGLLIGAVMHLLGLIELDATEAEALGSEEAANDHWKVWAYMCVLTAASLRGHKGFYLDLAGMRTHLVKGRVGTITPGINKNTVLLEAMCKNLPHVTICLLGKFKGETRVDQHLIAVANETSSGLCPWWWMKKLVAVCDSEGRVDGPAFTSPEGVLASSMDYDAMFRKYLCVVQEETNLNSGDHDVNALYSTFQTLRKMATMRIEQAGFGNQFVDQMNRWRPQERAQG